MINLWINSETNALLPNWNAFGTTTLPQIKQGDKIEFDIHWVKSDPSGQFMEEVIMPPASVLKVAVGLTNGELRGGYFTYSFEGDTVDIPYDADVDSFPIVPPPQNYVYVEKNANTLINSLPSIIAAGGVDVSIVNQRTFRVVFNQFGARALSSCDSTPLVPSTTVSVVRINAGTPTSKEVQHLRPKELPVAYSESFVNAPEPVISITDIDSITKRVSISPSPKFGTFTISNGTGTTSALSINSSASDVLSGLTGAGISSLTRTYSVAKSGDYSWDIYRTSGTSETLTITTNGLIGFSSKTGIVDFNTIEVEDLLAGQPSVNATLEVEYSYGTSKQTLYQGRVTIVNDIIDASTYNPIPFPEFGGGIGDAPIDGTKYARQDGAWVSFTEEDNQGITQSAGDARYAQQANNLSDLDDVSQARTNLNVYSISQTDSALAGKSDIGHNHNFFQLQKVDGGEEPHFDLDGYFLRVYNGGAGGGNNLVVLRESNSWSFPSLGGPMPPATIDGTWNLVDEFGNPSSGTVQITISFSKYIFRLNTGSVGLATHSEPSMHTWVQSTPTSGSGIEYYGDYLTIYADESSEPYYWTYDDQEEGISAGITVTTIEGTYNPTWSDFSFTQNPINYEFSKVKSTSYDEPVVKSGLLPSLTQELIREKAFSFPFDSSGLTKYGLLWDSLTGKFTLNSYPDLSQYAKLAGDTFTGKVFFTPVNGNAGINIGIGGTDISSPNSGDLWISTGGTTLNYRDGNGSWRTIATHNQVNTFTTNQIIAGSSTSPMLRVTQGGIGYSLVIEDSANPDPHATIVDGNGNVGIGVSNNPASPWAVDAKLAVKSSSSTPLVRLTQTGTGACLVVEDEASPDTSQFIIGNDGRVGIGGNVATSPSDKLAVYNGNIILTSGFGIIFGTGSTQTVPYIPSAVAITGGTIDNIIIDGGTF